MSNSPSFGQQVIFKTPCRSPVQDRTPYLASLRIQANFERLANSRSPTVGGKKAAVRKSKKKESLKPIKSARKCNFEMYGQSSKRQGKKSIKVIKKPRVGKNCENQYFGGQSKLSTGESLRRQRSQGDFNFSDVFKKDRHFAFSSSSSGRKSQIRSKLSHRRQSNMYIDKIQKMMEQESNRELMRQSQLSGVTGKEAVRLSKLHNIERTEIRQRIDDLRMQFNLLQRELLL